MAFPILFASAMSAIAVPPVPLDIVVIHPRAPFPLDRTVSAKDLAGMRGGVLLPNGLNIAIGIDIQSRVDGMLVLHTIYASDGPTAGISVYTDGSGAAATAPTTVSVTSPNVANGPTVIVDRSATGGTTVTSNAAVPVTLNLVQGASSTWLSADEQTKVAVTANGAPVASEAGAVTLQSDAQGAVVILAGPGLELRHLVGQATGVVVANTQSDRVIDTVSSINVDVQGLSPALMAGTFTANRIATEATLNRGGF